MASAHSIHATTVGHRRIRAGRAAAVIAMLVLATLPLTCGTTCYRFVRDLRATAKGPGPVPEKHPPLASTGRRIVGRVEVGHSGNFPLSA